MSWVKSKGRAGIYRATYDISGTFCAREHRDFLFAVASLLPQSCGFLNLEASYLGDFCQSDYDTRERLLDTGASSGFIHLPSSSERVIPNTVCTFPQGNWSFRAKGAANYTVIPERLSRAHFVRWKYLTGTPGGVNLREVKNSLSTLGRDYRLDKFVASDLSLELPFFSAQPREGAMSFYFSSIDMKTSRENARALYLDLVLLCESSKIECGTDPAPDLQIQPGMAVLARAS